MRARGTSLVTLGVTLGVLLAGSSVAWRPAEPAQVHQPIVDEGAVASVVAPVAAPAPEIAAPVAPLEVLPLPVEAPARAVFPSMKHIWQSLNNCGPAAVVMALSTLGVDIDQETARLALRGEDVRRGMGPQGVDPWVKLNWGLRSTWRNGGTVATIKKLVANGFAPMVTQWMQDPSISRIGHWRTIRGYDDAQGVFFVNDSMLGNMVPLTYEWFGRNWQSFNYRYMVIYRTQDEPLLKAIMGPQVSDAVMRRDLYERARSEAYAQNTNFAWLAYGEADYAYEMFEEAVAAFEKGVAMGSASGVFGIRNSYPQALRALGRRDEADKVQAMMQGISPVPSAAAPPPDPYALWLAFQRERAADPIQLTK